MQSPVVSRQSLFLQSPDTVAHDGHDNGGIESKDEISRDEEYYLDCAFVIFLVEDRLFKVPRRFFGLESEVFQEMFKLPAPGSGDVDGLTDEQPVHLAGVKKQEFRQLVRLMCSHYSVTHEKETFDLKEWVSILKLSTMWGMAHIRTYAIEHITTMIEGHPFNMIILGEAYDVDEWFLQGVQALICRQKPMGMDEVEILGAEDILKIAALREVARLDITLGRNWENVLRMAMSRKPDFTSVIRQAFGKVVPES